MSPGAIDDVNAPKSMKNIVLEVMEYVEAHRLPAITRVHEHPLEFKVYDEALHAVWPELHKISPEAHLRVSVSIYLEIADRWRFEASPPEIKGLKL